ncbi:MAG TPA: redox-sensing transcriptional repressor Rex [Candidatus Limnocylindrales bacterium]|nr:redox-sensing transcriptional repressor Rex [Candidatus Limnocylindrales bacterium]
MEKKKETLIGISQPALRRMPLYYRCLLQALEKNITVISSEELGQTANVNSALVRQDLSCLPKLGRPGIGYDARSLASQLEELLGLVNDKEAVLVGVGHLGYSLALYPGFAPYRLQIIALFDNDPNKVGQLVAERRILAMEKLPSLVKRLHIQMGIITVPATAAQAVVEIMIDAGIKMVWNFAPCRLTVPDGVLVKNEDLAASLAAFSCQITQSKIAMQQGGKTIR